MFLINNVINLSSHSAVKGTVFILIFAILAGCVRMQKEKYKSRPNVVILLADDQGWGDLSFNGNTNLSTPHIDKLGNEGASFKWFYVCPVCSPTRAEMLTGRYHTRGGVYSTSSGGERLDTDETTIADIFKSAGYATAAYGKWHNGMQYPYHPNARGFDDFYGFCSGHWGNYFSPVLEHNGKLVRGNGYISDDLTDHALDFIEKNKDNPFFLYVPYNLPHAPMQIPNRWWKEFENKELAMVYKDPGKEDLQFTKAALAMCENIDWNVGRILSKLKDLKLTENTIIVYFSDNGPSEWRWNGNMKGKKGSTDEGGVRSPLLISWPKRIKAGEKIENIAAAIDLLPTLTDLAGIDYATNKPLDGKSLKPILTGESVKVDNRFIVSYWNKKLSVRNQQYRLDNEGKLYDMEKDIGQDHDISKQEPETTRELKMAAEDWRKDALAELTEKNIRPFTIGHPDAKYTQIPARDGIGHGHIERSNSSPNCSYFTNWINTEDKITWDVEIIESGNFEVMLYYTCSGKDVGATIVLSLGNNRITGKITEPNDPPLKGMEHDRVKRRNSYVKDFKPMNLGTIHLEKGKGQLKLRALTMPGSQVMDFRLMMFERIR